MFFFFLNKLWINSENFTSFRSLGINNFINIINQNV